MYEFPFVSHTKNNDVLQGNQGSDEEGDMGIENLFQELDIISKQSNQNIQFISIISEHL